LAEFVHGSPEVKFRAQAAAQLYGLHPDGETVTGCSRGARDLAAFARQIGRLPVAAALARRL